MESDKKLKIKVQSARDLINLKNSSGKASPYCEINLLNAAGEPIPNFVTKTNPVKNSLSPTWNQDLEFVVPGDWAGIQVRIFDKHKFRSDKFMGQVTVKFNPELLKGREAIDDWFRVSARKSSEPVSGEIHLKIQYDAGKVAPKQEEKKLKTEEKKPEEKKSTPTPDKKKALKGSGQWNAHDSDLKSSSHIVIEEEIEEEDDDDDEEMEDDEEVGDDDEDEDYASEDYDDGNWDMEEDFEEPVKKSKPISLTASAILSVREQEISSVSDILKIPPHISMALMKHYNWDKERLMTKFIENPEGTCKEAGVEMPGQTSNDADVDEIVCSICFEDSKDTITSLSCKHYFCNNCWNGYLGVQIKEGNTLAIKCMAHKCNQLVPDYIVKKIVKPELFQKYAQFLSQAFVDSNPNVKWCPTPGCDCAIDISQTEKEGKNTVARCGKCNFKFCFQCAKESHTPATCDYVKAWERKCQDDSETFNWIAANTKDCPNPKCAVSIEKNDGCFMMTCFKCHFQFCWLCCQDWKTHSDHFSCSKYKGEKLQNKPLWIDQDDKEKNSTRSALDRYLHYYNLFINHHNSLKFEEKTREKIRATMEQLQAKGASYIDVQYLEEAASQLNECRQTLKWTYVWAFYETDPLKKNLFEFFQSDLEMIAERVSRKLIGKPEDIKKDELNSLIRIARNSLHNLLKDENL